MNTLLDEDVFIPVFIWIDRHICVCGAYTEFRCLSNVDTFWWDHTMDERARLIVSARPSFKFRTECCYITLVQMLYVD